MNLVSGLNANGWRRLLAPLLLSLAMAMTGSAPARADNTFLLQLGTYDTEKEATQKWGEVKSKNTDVLGSYSLHIAEVSLPPENKPSFRTQVGPVTSRSQAESLCGTLQGRGVDCYVVETAMFTSETAPDQPQEEAKPATPAPAITASTPAPAESHKHVALAEEDTSHADDPDYIPPPVDSGPVIISSTGATVEPAAAVAPAAPAPAEIAQASTPEPAAEVPLPVTRHRKPARAQVAEEDEEETQHTPSYLPHDNRPATRSGADHFVPGRQPRFLDQEAPTETQVAAAAPAPAPIAAQPAPKPKRGFFSRLFGSSEDEQPAPAPVTVAAPAPAPTPGGAPATTAQSVTGSVNVAEAIRVPLSSDNQPPRQKIVPVLPAVHGVGGYPSESTAKTFWAQISYFRDETQALNFYRQFSNSYPQYAEGVRLRITRPFTGGGGRVSLRVGPFAGTEDVHTICDAANRWKARCTVVRDIGASVAMDNSANARPAREGRLAAAPVEEPLQSHGLYWAQLGTYQFSQDAWDAWSELRSTHRRILGKLKASVTAPPESSAAGALFRLRAGPFTSESTASRLCSHLQAAGAGCIVSTDH